MKLMNHSAFLILSVLGLQLAGCGSDTSSDSKGVPSVSGVSTGGTGDDIAPGLGGDTNATLDTNINSNNGVIVNSPTQSPLLATETALSAYPLRLVQTQASVQFFATNAPSVVKHTLKTALKPEGMLSTIDGAMALFSTPTQTGYQVISFDGTGFPLASKVYGVNGKAMAIRYQQSDNHSYFIDLLLNNDLNTATHQRFKVIDGVMTSTNKTLNLSQKIVAAVSNIQYMIWIGQDTQQAYWLNALQCTANTTTCTELVPIKLDGEIAETTDNPRSTTNQLTLIGEDIQVKANVAGQTVTKSFAIVGTNVTAKF